MVIKHLGKLRDRRRIEHVRTNLNFVNVVRRRDILRDNRELVFLRRKNRGEVTNVLSRRNRDVVDKNVVDNRSENIMLRAIVRSHGCDQLTSIIDLLEFMVNDENITDEGVASLLKLLISNAVDFIVNCYESSVSVIFSLDLILVSKRNAADDLEDLVLIDILYLNSGIIRGVLKANLVLRSMLKTMLINLSLE